MVEGSPMIKIEGLSLRIWKISILRKSLMIRITSLKMAVSLNIMPQKKVIWIATSSSLTSKCPELMSQRSLVFMWMLKFHQPWWKRTSFLQLCYHYYQIPSKLVLRDQKILLKKSLLFTCNRCQKTLILEPLKRKDQLRTCNRWIQSFNKKFCVTINFWCLLRVPSKTLLMLLMEK